MVNGLVVHWLEFNDGVVTFVAMLVKGATGTSSMTLSVSEDNAEKELEMVVRDSESTPLARCGGLFRVMNFQSDVFVADWVFLVFKVFVEVRGGVVGSIEAARCVSNLLT